MVNAIKIVIIIYISIGLVFSTLLGIEYYCGGPEMFMPYFGNPFVFKKLSPGASMTYYYGISGLVLNVAFWSFVLLVIQNVVIKLINRLEKKRNVNIVHKVVVFFLICYSTLNIYIESNMIGAGFEEELNYWYMNMDKEAESWGLECEGELTILSFVE